MATFKFKKAGTTAKIRSAVAYGLEVLGDRIYKRLRQTLNTPYPPASQPGDPPHRRTGRLRNATYYRVNKAKSELHVGFDARKARYWRFLEGGTKKMDPRPSLKPVLDALYPQMGRVVTQAANKKLK